ncbi:MAG: TraR/DksA C4-type zinc finger protein [Coriobacteriia bacterium]|nr:TraR/DksA C4-type zinc finger protein [Coriobacteriia bacterium]MBN2839983.1 TraR/DksA C4-type zinc finger protein [Coriobacteriia bacterium]
MCEAVDFHGHLCPGLTIGYVAARIAMTRLGVMRGSDEELVGIVETDACGIDAFQYLTGCTLGKGNLIFRDHGKQVFTLVRRSDGRGVRVALRGAALGADTEQVRLKARVISGDATDEERAAYRRGSVARVFELLGLDDEQFADITSVEVDLPGKAGNFPSIACSICGEAVMEPRARVRDGEPCCIPCATRYGRGWEINV